MGKSTLPCGCDESYAIYFGQFIACTNASHKDGEPTPTGQRYRKWEWVPAHWREILPKPPAKEKSSATGPIPSPEGLSHNPVVGKVA